MNRRNQTGFSPVIIVIAVAAVMAIVLIAWRVYDANRSTNQNNNQNSSANNTPKQQEPTQQPETDPNEGYLVIKEWGVRFKPVEGLGVVKYFRAANTPSAYDRYDLSTASLIEREPNCQTTGFSSITRTTEPQTVYESLLAKIGDYYYYYRGADAACSESAANMTFESEQRSAVKQSLITLEVAK